MFAQLEQADALMARIVAAEQRREQENLIMIPSESRCPEAVLAALATPFSNIYAEGYPLSRFTRGNWERGWAEDIERHAAFSHRYHSRRFYQGTLLANIIESLVQERVAQVLATDKVPAEHIHVNVQPLSGAPANMAVYTALLQPGDPVMGLPLPAGGHLTHFAPYNRSGQLFRSYEYRPGADGQLDYEQMRRTALEHRPKIIVGGSTSYPWAFDWERMRAIADEVGAYLLADVSHPIGLIIAGYYPNPIEHAHVVTFTTHKTFLGPRAACIATANSNILGKLVDRGVFPGEQGGPHLNTIMAVGVAAKFARTPEFKQIQQRTVANAAALVRFLQQRDVPVAFGGTNSHYLLVDLKGLRTRTATRMCGDMAARVLEEIGIVVNKNTIPGDETAGDSSGIRIGTTWLSQLGADERMMEEIADIMAEFLGASYNFPIRTSQRLTSRARLPQEAFERARARVRSLAKQLHPQLSFEPAPLPPGEHVVLEIRGDRTDLALSIATTANVMSLEPGQGTVAFFLDDQARIIAGVWLLYQRFDSTASQLGERVWRIIVPRAQARDLNEYLTLLSRGYLLVDREDIRIKVPGPFVVTMLAQANVSQTALEELTALPQEGSAVDLPARFPAAFDLTKPYFIGQRHLPVQLPAKTVWQWQAPATPTTATPGWINCDGELCQTTPLYAQHQAAGARMVPFAGWAMPVHYPDGPLAEHAAVRTSVGLFDVGHMGVLSIQGPHAAYFLDMVTTSHIMALPIGKAVYSSLPGPDGHILDDIIVYHYSRDEFLMVINAANAQKDLAWLLAVNQAQAAINLEAPWKQLGLSVTIKDLKDPAQGAARKIDLALQGPRSLELLLPWCTPQDRVRLTDLQSFELTSLCLADIPVVIARTGYTGSPVGFEILVHPDQAPALWDRLTSQGELQAQPIGLGARDSLRCEAGLPLYGHDLGNDELTLVEIGYGQYVKPHAKPFFIGRQEHIKRQQKPRGHLIRFENTGTVMISHRYEEYRIHNLQGKCLGKITSLVYTHRNPNRQVGLGLVSQPVPAGRTVLMVRTKGEQVRGYVPVKVLSRYPTVEEIQNWPVVYANT